MYNMYGLAIVLLGVCFVREVITAEEVVQCSAFQWQEQLLLKVLRMELRLEAMESELAAKQREHNGGFAFSAYLDHDVVPGDKQTIVFNQIVTNDGNGYNTHTGIFTCPEAGLYLFTYFLGERSESAVIHQCFSELRVNNAVVIGAVAETVHTNQDSQGGNVVVVRLQVGDAVWVGAAGTCNHIEGSYRRFSTFTGVYLYT